MSDRWFIVNVADARAQSHPVAGSWVRFEPEDARFPDYGINIHILAPGEPNGRYHREEAQEDFLVLAGECIAIVEGEEHRLKAWDFVHCPAGTTHIFVGAGDGLCAILMVGARGDDRAIHYPVEPVAARYGASVATPTDSPQEAYADWPRGLTDTTIDWPLT